MCPRGLPPRPFRITRRSLSHLPSDCVQFRCLFATLGNSSSLNVEISQPFICAAKNNCRIEDTLAPRLVDWKILRIRTVFLRCWLVKALVKKLSLNIHDFREYYTQFVFLIILQPIISNNLIFMYNSSTCYIRRARQRIITRVIETFRNIVKRCSATQLSRNRFYLNYLQRNSPETTSLLFTSIIYVFI